MALHGSLDSFTIPEVLRLLAGTEKSGYLALTGDRGNGGTWLDDGRLIGGRADAAQAEAEMVDILFELLRFEAGEFSFEEDRECATPNEPVDVDALLGAAETMLAEFRRLEKVVPSFEHVVELVETLPKEKVELNQGLWDSIVAAGRCHTIRDIGATLELGDLELLRAMRNLVEADLATLTEPAEAVEEVEEVVVDEVETEVPFDMAEPNWKDSSTDEDPETDPSADSPFDGAPMGADDRTDAWGMPEPGSVADDDPIFASTLRRVGGVGRGRLGDPSVAADRLPGRHRLRQRAPPGQRRRMGPRPRRPAGSEQRRGRPLDGADCGPGRVQRRGRHGTAAGQPEP